MFLKTIVFLPLIASILSGLFSMRKLDGLAILTTIISISISFILSCFAFFYVAIDGNFLTLDIAKWISVYNFEVNWALKFDTLSSVMLFVVTSVSLCVHIYSIGYMSHDPSKGRFMSYLSFFTFAMLILVTSDNLVQLFFGWEGVGVASYLLIGFWYKKESAHKAAMKAFIVNRVGDFGFALGILCVFFVFESVQFSYIFSNVPEYLSDKIIIFGIQFSSLEVISILLFIGAMGKSAQLGLHTWLPDAMEGPTPVSALIHAATMVTAGVFLVCRMSPILEFAPFSLSLITIVGALTCIFAATIAITQFDIKRVIAYSTCSQLGYMFFAAGVSAYPAAMFHLTTHAFFKALLFLGAGSVIHAFSNEQDLRKMGGVWNKIPFTYCMMWIGSLALAGFPFFAGYYSKDMILEVSFASNTFVGNFAYIVGCLAAILTAFYSWRLIFLAFHGSNRSNKEVFEKVHESPNIMTIPLLPLALGAIFSGWFGYEIFVGDNMLEFWKNSIFILPENDSILNAHNVPFVIKKIPTICAILGVSVAILFYLLFPKLPSFFVSRFFYLHKLFFNKWFFDEFYNLVFVKSSLKIGSFFWYFVDKKTIDFYGPDGLSKTVSNISRKLVLLQTGYVYHYAFAMMIGVVIILSWYFVSL